MIRLIKRYGSRKLYDTEESRYVSLEEISGWVREGQQIRVIDKDSGDDVTSQTLTQVILDEGRRGRAVPSSELLHQVIRRGGTLVSSGVEQLSQGVERLLQAGADRLGPIRDIREETQVLRQRLEELEASIAQLERNPREDDELKSDSNQEATTPSVGSH